MRSSVEWRAAHVDETQPSSVTLRLSPDWSVSRRTIAYLVSSRLDYRTLFATDADTVSIACAEHMLVEEILLYMTTIASPGPSTAVNAAIASAANAMLTDQYSRRVLARCRLRCLFRLVPLCLQQGCDWWGIYTAG